MIQHLPEWIMKRYAKLWTRFKDKEFTKEEAKKTLNGDSSLAVFLSDLKKAGWLEMKMAQDDARKTIYKLKNPSQAILEMIKEMSKK